MSNSRLSYKANTTVGAINTSQVTIASSGYPDNNTNHLFPGDVSVLLMRDQNGCIGSTTYTVDSIISATQFNLTAPLAAAVDTSGYVIATQSGTWNVTFTVTQYDPEPEAAFLFQSRHQPYRLLPHS